MVKEERMIVERNNALITVYSLAELAQNDQTPVGYYGRKMFFGNSYDGTTSFIEKLTGEQQHDTIKRAIFRNSDLHISGGVVHSREDPIDVQVLTRQSSPVTYAVLNMSLSGIRPRDVVA